MSNPDDCLPKTPRRCSSRLVRRCLATPRMRIRRKKMILPMASVAASRKRVAGSRKRVAGSRKRSTPVRSPLSRAESGSRSCARGWLPPETAQLLAMATEPTRMCNVVYARRGARFAKGLPPARSPRRRVVLATKSCASGLPLVRLVPSKNRSRPGRRRSAASMVPECVSVSKRPSKRGR